MAVLWPNTAAAEEARVAVVIGSNVGLGHERPLQYAEQDARRFYSLVTEIGGVEKERAYLVTGGDASAVRRAVDEAKGRIHELARLGPTALIVYVSAHADEENLHLEGTTLSVAELRQRVGQTPASLRLVIIDACRTPVQTAPKGGSPGPSVSVNLHRSEKLQGDLYISSTSRGEPAQEWSFLKGALFTHHLVTGLRGAADLDGNGRISLSEGYSYAFRRTLSGAVTAEAGPQHPSFDFHMAGHGDWTFTSPGRERSAIVLGESIAGTVWIVDRNSRIVAEVEKVKGTPVRLAVSPGWYRVIVPEENRALVTDVSLAFGKERTVDSRDLVSLRLRDVVERGTEPVVLRPLLLSMRYYFSNGTVEGIGGFHLGALSLDLFLGGWTAGLLLFCGGDRFDAVRSSVTHIEGELHLRGGREVVFANVSLWLGLFGGVARVWQTVTADRQDELEAYGFDTTSKQKAWLPSVGVYTALGVPLTERLWLTVDGAFGAKWIFMNDQEVAVDYDGRIGIGVGWRL